MTSPYAEGIDEDQHRRLDGDAAKDVAHSDTELPAEGSACRDGDLGEVGDDGKEDQSSKRLPQPKPFQEHICSVGEANPRSPDRACRGCEDQGQNRQGEGA
jgi:hypothetical protein